uniref:NADH dehydrogenase subunit 6 n=1 Tax=Scelimena sp. 1 XDL-2023a TaxID=3071528 RepID=A0AA50NSE6_9ORTH|nr:NADH dehydrogenase subunit 6 [Scelimena sp. 1 XDL-2023a]
MKIIMSTSMLLNILFTQTKKPMNIIIIILMQTSLMTMTMSTKTQSPWFSYLLMIIFIGGMMVAFVYITSIMPNEKNNYNKIIIALTIMLATLMMTVSNMKTHHNNNETQLTETIQLAHNSSIMLNNMFNKPMFTLYIMTTIYLFITLIAVSNISNIEMGPMRKKIN